MKLHLYVAKSGVPNRTRPLPRTRPRNREKGNGVEDEDEDEYEDEIWHELNPFPACGAEAPSSRRRPANLI